MLFRYNKAPRVVQAVLFTCLGATTFCTLYSIQFFCKKFTNYFSLRLTKTNNTSDTNNIGLRDWEDVVRNMR